MEMVVYAIWAGLTYAVVALGAWAELERADMCAFCRASLALLWPMVLLFRFGIWVMEER